MLVIGFVGHLLDNNELLLSLWRRSSGVFELVLVTFAQLQREREASC